MEILTSSDAHDQIAAFVGALYEPDDVVEIRRLPSARSTWHRAGDVEQIAAACAASNRSRENVYIGVNPRVAFGRRGNAGVALMRCVFADFDAKHLKATTPAEQVAEARQRIADAWLPDPAVMMLSGHGLHSYWRLAEPVTDLTAWSELMDALITTLGSDPGAKGGDRIMRAPGLVNWKEPIALAELVKCDPTLRCEWDDIATVFHANLPEPPVAGNVEQAIAAHRRRDYGPDRVSVIDAFNAAVPVAEILTAAGYDVAGRSFRRPGKQDRSFSGIIRPNRNGVLVSAHWSTNDPLNDQRFGHSTCGVHDSFSAFTLLEHGGNVAAAVKAAAALLSIPLPKQKADKAVMEDVTASVDADAFAGLFFADPQTHATRQGMTAILARFTTNPRQVERIVAMAGKAVTA